MTKELTMSESTKRAIRTFVQAVLGVAAAIAVAVPLMPPGGQRYAAVIAGAAVAAATIAKIWAALEDAGILPTWLRGAGQLDDDAYNAAWHAGHTAATAARAGTDRGAADVTMIRPVLPAEQGSSPAFILDSRRRALQDREPGEHSPDRGNRIPTSERARPVVGKPAAASAPVPDGPRYPELDPREVLRQLDDEQH